MVDWKYIFLLTYLLILVIKGSEEQLECPSKELSDLDCGASNNCHTDQFCLKLTHETGKYGCCEKSKSHCSETRLHAITAVSNEYQGKWIWKEGATSDSWYKKEIIINGEESIAACPKPSAFQLSGLKEEALPVGFEEGGKTLMNCGKSTDCGKDEFCGHSYNPTYCEKEKLPEDFYNHCLDKSNNGQPMQFCYKDPEVATNEFRMRRDRVGFDVCNDQKDCGTQSICVLASKNHTFRKVDEKGLTDGLEYNGICLDAHICVGAEYDNVVGFLPKNLRSCDMGASSVCGKKSRCVATDAGINLCCVVAEKMTGEFEGSNDWWPIPWIVMVIVIVVVLCAVIGIVFALWWFNKLHKCCPCVKKGRRKAEPDQEIPNQLATPAANSTPATPATSTTTTATTATTQATPATSSSTVASTTPANNQTPTSIVATAEEGPMNEECGVTATAEEAAEENDGKIAYNGRYKHFYKMSRENQISFKEQEDKLKKEAKEHEDDLFWF